MVIYTFIYCFIYKLFLNLIDLMKAFDKYSEKLMEKLSKAQLASPEKQVAAFKLLESFLKSFGETFDLNENEKFENDLFMESLERYPVGSIQNHYKELWKTLNSLEEEENDDIEINFLIDSAISTFSEQFVKSCSETFVIENSQPEVKRCMFQNMNFTFNEAVTRIGYTLEISSEN